MSVKLLTEHHLEFLCLQGGCTGSSESTLVKVPHCWKSHVAAQMCDYYGCKDTLTSRYNMYRDTVVTIRYISRYVFS